MPSPAYDLEAIRAEIPVLDRLVPLNNCSQAPPCRATLAAADAYLDSWRTDVMDWPSWMDEVEAARRAFAALIGADPSDVAVGTSVSQLTASTASGLDWSGPRRRVVVSGMEFPTVSHVWMAQERSGAEVFRAERDATGVVPMEAWEAAIDERTLVVSAAHAWYQTGATQDLEAIAEVAHARGALLYADVYQILGTEPFNAPTCGADFVASGVLKYLMGIPGIAFLWIRPGLAERLRPTLTGWFGRTEPFAFDDATLDWAPGARRLETGTPPVFEVHVARAGLEWLHALGLDAIGDWTATLSARLVTGAADRGLDVWTPPDPTAKAPTTAVRCADAHAVEAAMRARGFVVSARGPAVRLAPHFYNTLDEMDQSLDALADVVGEHPAP